MKKSVIIIFVILTVLILAVAGFFLLRKSALNVTNNINPENQDGVSENIKTIIHKDFQATIDSDWEESEGYNLGYIFYTYLPPEENRQSNSAEFIFISVGHIGEEINYSLDELLEEGIKQSKATMPDLNLTSNIYKENPYFSGKEIRFTGTSEGVMRNFVQFFGIKYGNIYTITYTCPLNNCDYYSIYDSLIESFDPLFYK